LTGEDEFRPDEVAPRQYYELGKALPTSKYFPDAGEHNVSWKGGGFRSSKITIEIPSNPK
jgi:hypothetical protein